MHTISWVDADTLYAATGDGLAALNAKSGTRIWSVPVLAVGNSPLGLQDGVLYSISDNNEGLNVTIDGFRASDGSQLWHIPLNGSVMDWVAVVA